MLTSVSTKHSLTGVVLLALLSMMSPVKSFTTIERRWYDFAGKTPQRKSATNLGWSLPAPLVNSLGHNRRWYQDLGYPADRRVEYQDDECTIWNDECGFGLVSSMSLLDDDTLWSPTDDDGQTASVSQRRRIGTRPLRMARGIWRRIRRNPR
jgi:hypothetical protein